MSHNLGVAQEGFIDLLKMDPFDLLEQCSICEHYIELLQAVITESGTIICKECDKKMDESQTSS